MNDIPSMSARFWEQEDVSKNSTLPVKLFFLKTWSCWDLLMESISSISLPSSLTRTQPELFFPDLTSSIVTQPPLQYCVLIGLSPKHLKKSYLYLTLPVRLSQFFPESGGGGIFCLRCEKPKSTKYSDKVFFWENSNFWGQ